MSRASLINARERNIPAVALYLAHTAYPRFPHAITEPSRLRFCWNPLIVDVVDLLRGIRRRYESRVCHAPTRALVYCCALLLLLAGSCG